MRVSGLTGDITLTHHQLFQKRFSYDLLNPTHMLHAKIDQLDTAQPVNATVWLFNYLTGEKQPTKSIITLLLWLIVYTPGRMHQTSRHGIFLSYRNRDWRSISLLSKLVRSHRGAGSANLSLSVFETVNIQWPWREIHQELCEPIRTTVPHFLPLIICWWAESPTTAQRPLFLPPSGVIPLLFLSAFCPDVELFPCQFLWVFAPVCRISEHSEPRESTREAGRGKTKWGPSPLACARPALKQRVGLAGNVWPHQSL